MLGQINYARLVAVQLHSKLGETPLLLHRGCGAGGNECSNAAHMVIR